MHLAGSAQSHGPVHQYLLRRRAEAARHSAQDTAHRAPHGGEARTRARSARVRGAQHTCQTDGAPGVRDSASREGAAARQPGTVCAPRTSEGSRCAPAVHSKFITGFKPACVVRERGRGQIQFNTKCLSPCSQTASLPPPIDLPDLHTPDENPRVPASASSRRWCSSITPQNTGLRAHYKHGAHATTALGHSPGRC